MFALFADQILKNRNSSDDSHWWQKILFLIILEIWFLSDLIANQTMPSFKLDRKNLIIFLHANLGLLFICLFGANLHVHKAEIKFIM